MNTNSVEWGDMATWVGAIGSIAVAIVAVTPILLSHRERKARGRLVASFLYNPLALAASIMKQARDDLHEYTKVLSGSASVNVRARAFRLRNMCGEVSAHLDNFNLADASSLPARIGQDLADAIPQARMCIKCVETSTQRYFKADGLKAPDGDDARFAAANNLSFILEPYDQAVEHLTAFVNYCRREFDIP